MSSGQQRCLAACFEFMADGADLCCVPWLLCHAIMMMVITNDNNNNMIRTIPTVIINSERGSVV